MASGIFTARAGRRPTSPVTTGPPFSFVGAPSINTSGTVAFTAFLDAGGNGIFTSAGGRQPPSPSAAGRPFSGFSGTSINTSGTVAFFANLDAGGSGIYLGDGGAGTRVVGTGDALNGSTVSSLEMGPGGLNDAGQVGFRYVLANGTYGVAVATVVPEPTSFLLVGLGIIGLGFTSRRKK